jgi:hypothetical protein
VALFKNLIESIHREKVRQPVELVGPGVSSEEIAAYFGITPKRQAEIRELFRSYHETNARQNGGKTKRTAKRLSRRNPRQESNRLSVPSVREDYVFLNLPYDTAFERLYLAYIVGITAFRLFPHTTLESLT